MVQIPPTCQHAPAKVFNLEAFKSQADILSEACILKIPQQGKNTTKTKSFNSLMSYVRGEGCRDRHDLISCSESWRAHWNVDHLFQGQCFKCTNEGNVIEICFNCGNGEFKTNNKILTTCKLNMKMWYAFYKLTGSLQRQYIGMDSHSLKAILHLFCQAFLPISRDLPPAIAKFHFRLPVNQKPKAKVIHSHQLSYTFHLES